VVNYCANKGSNSLSNAYVARCDVRQGWTLTNPGGKPIGFTEHEKSWKMESEYEIVFHAWTETNQQVHRLIKSQEREKKRQQAFTNEVSCVTTA
jgi:hypothetical protein